MSLSFTAAVMALIDPYVLWDVGFQLSFAATLGLVLYGSPSQAAVAPMAGRVLPPASAQRLASLVSEYFLFTLAASMTTLPITLYHFGRLSLVSLVANPAILPAQPPLMVLGGLSLIAGSLFEPLGRLLAAVTLPFAVYTVRAAELFASLPGSTLPVGPVSLAWVACFYVILFGLTFFGGRVRTGLVGRLGIQRPALAAAFGVVLLASVAGAALAWKAYYSAPDGRLHLTGLDVGSGDALLIQTPGGRTLLAGGGPSASALSDALGRRLPPGSRRLDMLIVANPAEEQVMALPRLLERFPPEQVLWAGPTHASPSARSLQTALSEARILPVPAQSGQTLGLGEGAMLRVLSANERGAVLLLEWGSFSALLPFGMDVEALEALQNDPGIGPVSALLLAESGYAPLNPPEWIERLRPGVVLLSVAPGDRVGRPFPETLEAVEGHTFLRTDRNGWIELTTDGENLWVEVEKK